MACYKEKLEEEIEEFDGKIVRLNDFIKKAPVFLTLSEEEKTLYIRKQYIMEQYIDILQQIERHQ